LKIETIGQAPYLYLTGIEKKFVISMT